MKRTQYTRRAAKGCARVASRAGAEGLEPRLMLAAQLLADVNVTPWEEERPFHPGQPFSLGSFALYAHLDRAGDVELWRTDGTAAGTHRVKDIATGNPPSFSASNPREFVRVGNVAYFLASPSGTNSDVNPEAELWRSDGTEAGTYRVAKTNPTGRDTVNALIAVDSRLYFFADDGLHGNELWTSDGTAAGTRMVEEVFAGPEGLASTQVGTDGTRLLFQGYRNFTLYQPGTIFVSDGTAAGTGPVPVAGMAGAFHYITPHEGRAYFADSNGYLFRTNANASGATRLSDTALGVVNGMVAVEGAVFLTNFHPHLLYRYTDAGGLVEVKTRGGNTLFDVAHMTAAGGVLYLSARDGVEPASTGRELFRVAPGGSTATLVTDVVPGAGESLPSDLTLARDTLFLTARDAQNPLALYKVANASAGASPATRVATLPMPDGFRWVGRTTSLGNLLIFKHEHAQVGWELWRSDGTEAGTGYIADANPMTNGSDPWWRVPFKGKVLFRADDGVHGAELWITDGTAAGTQLLADTNPGPGGNDGFWRFTPTASGERVFFVGGTAGGQELWVTDGTPGGTRPVNNSYPSGVSAIVAAGERVYFSAYDTLKGRELWASDGTGPGTYRVTDIGPGSAGAFPADGHPTPAVLPDGSVMFAANDGARGMELWRTDGTAAGTALLRDIHPGATGSSPGALWRAGGFVYFAATDPVNGRELWRTDGTPAGTVMVADILPGPQGSSPAGDAGGGPVLGFGPIFGPGPGFLEYNGRVYFSAVGAGVGRELFRTDGTAAGTTLVKDHLPGAGSGNPREMVVVGGKLYLAAVDRPNTADTAQVWVSDGTSAGTSPLWQQGVFAAAWNLLAHNGRLFFDGVRADQAPAVGLRLFSTDGTLAGTAPVADLATDTRIDYVGGATPLGGALFSHANDYVHGREPWRFSDEWAPRVESAALVRQPAGDAVVVRLTEDVGATLTEADVTVRDVSTGQQVPASLRVSYDRASATATVTFPGYAGGVLPNGNYRLTVRGGGVADAAGNVLAADYVLDFFALSGDINRDRAVNGTDFALLAANFGRSGRTYEHGDLNADGFVNGTDFALLAGNFGKFVPEPAPAPAPVGADTTETAPAPATPIRRHSNVKMKPKAGGSSLGVLRRRPPPEESIT